MGVNKVEYGSSTLVDLTGDTVTPETLLQGETAHNAAGNRITGTARPGVQSFNGRSGSVLPIAGDYSADQVNYDSNKTVKQVIDALATKETSDITGQQSLLKDTVGWTGKNLLNDDIYFYESGISVNKSGHTFTIETTTVATRYASLMFRPSNNTMYPAGQYKLSLDVSTIGDATARVAIRRSNNSIISVKILSVGANLLEIDTSEDFYISVFPRFEKTNVVTLVFSNPMLRRADISDPTYEPYHESVEVMYEEEIHGVNLLKNIATSRTVNGVTFTVNADGSVTANGTATATAELAICGRNNSSNPNVYDDGKYIGNGCPSGGSTSTYMMFFDTNNADGTLKRMVTDVGNGGEFTITDNQSSTYPSNRVQVMIRIANGVTVSNLVFKPMLRKADIEDSTYRPYNHQAIQNQLNAQGVLGAKNGLNITMSNKTQDGLTFTVNDDGSVTVNGTATANGGVHLVSDTTLSYDGYILSGNSSTDNNKIKLLYYDVTAKKQFDVPANGEVLISGTNGDICRVALNYYNGVTFSNLTFYPMLRLASDPDDTYVPYAMTNKELTEKVFEKRTLTSNDNLNNITETGIYTITSAPVNSPENVPYCSLLVQAQDSYNIRQIVFKNSNNIGSIYTRDKGGSPSTWHSWYKFTGTVVS